MSLLENKNKLNKVNRVEILWPAYHKDDVFHVKLPGSIYSVGSMWPNPQDFIIILYTNRQIPRCKCLFYIFILYTVLFYIIYVMKNMDITTSLKLEGYFSFLLGEMKYFIILSGDESQILTRRFSQ